MKKVTEFRSMLSAIAYLAGEHADHAFVVREDMEEGTNAVAEITQEDLSPTIASTLAEFAMEAHNVAAYIVESEAYYGVILIHYTTDGDIVRFVAIPS